MANILIVDDHPMARLAIRMLLEKEKHTIVAESGNGMEALKLTQNIQPDIMVIDLDIPGLSGVELIEKLRKGGFLGRLLVLTGRDDDHYLSRSIAIGADGFVSKGNNLDELRDAVRAVSRGYSYFPLPRDPAAGAIAPAAASEVIKTLSGRELQVLRYLAQGIKIMDIAQKMHVSNKTISTYKSRLFAKLGIDSSLKLIDFARRHNLD